MTSRWLLLVLPLVGCISGFGSDVSVDGGVGIANDLVFVETEALRGSPEGIWCLVQGAIGVEYGEAGCLDGPMEALAPLRAVSRIDDGDLAVSQLVEEDGVTWEVVRRWSPSMATVYEVARLPVNDPEQPRSEVTALWLADDRVWMAWTEEGEPRARRADIDGAVWETEGRILAVTRFGTALIATPTGLFAVQSLGDPVEIPLAGEVLAGRAADRSLAVLVEQGGTRTVGVIEFAELIASTAVEPDTELLGIDEPWGVSLRDGQSLLRWQVGSAPQALVDEDFGWEPTRAVAEGNLLAVVEQGEGVSRLRVVRDDGLDAPCDRLATRLGGVEYSNGVFAYDASDADGEWRFEACIPGGSTSVLVDHPDYPTRSLAEPFLLDDD